MPILETVIGGGGLIAILIAMMGAQKATSNEIKKRLYDEDGITLFLLRKEAEQMENRLCRKMDELKVMIQRMDEKRETTKDEYQHDLQNIYSRLATIEAKLPPATTCITGTK